MVLITCILGKEKHTDQAVPKEKRFKPEQTYPCKGKNMGIRKSKKVNFNNTCIILGNLPQVNTS